MRVTKPGKESDYLGRKSNRPASYHDKICGALTIKNNPMP